VTLNLIMNAIEAMRAVDRERRELVVSTDRDELGNVRIAVSDLGPGVPFDDVERLFEPFYTTKATGMGMGLSICRSIIEAHGGRLWATANEPGGSVFHFTVPAQRHVKS
jgi:signal transduction histidine kinase